MQINALRGLLYEYGEAFARGRAPLVRGIAAAVVVTGVKTMSRPRLTSA
jgi:hypothetical protein